MKTIILNIQEFINFKCIFKDKFSSKIQKGNVVITANESKLANLGYV